MIETCSFIHNFADYVKNYHHILMLSNKRFEAVFWEQMQHLLENCGSVGHTKRGGTPYGVDTYSAAPFRYELEPNFKSDQSFFGR